MNAEQLLNSVIVREGDLTPVLDAKVTSDFYANDDDREVFVWILSHWSEYGQVPGSRALKNNFPTYKLIDGKEPYEYYLDEVRRRRKYGLIFETLAEATELLEEEDLDGAEGVLADGLMRAQIEISELRDTDIVQTWQRRLETYESWKKEGRTLRGIPSGFPTIDDGLRGFQAQQLITFVGAPKAGKSWLMLKMAMAAHDFGKRPLFIGFEMSNEEQEARHDALAAEISYTRLLKGTYTNEEGDKLRRALKRRRSGDPFIFGSDPEGATVSSVASKIEQYQPDIVFIDGAYMMEDEGPESQPRGTPQALTNVTRALKRLARRREIPIVISTQVLLWKINKKKGLDEAAIGYTSSFIQDSDVVLGVETPGDDPNSPIKRLKVVLGRTAPKFEVGLFWNWDELSVVEMAYDPADPDGEFGTASEVKEEPPEEDVEEDTWDPKRKVVRRKPRVIEEED
ncbi:MAG: DnaB-like helicase C-terminal domain-containing protein [Dermatophilaceae bacterium]